MKYLLVFCTVAAFSGCTLIPGSHIPSGNSSWYSTGDETKAADLDELVDFHAITPALITRMRATVTDGPALNSALDQEMRDYEYVVNRGDVLNITVWDHPELTIPAGGERPTAEAGNWVHSDGTIFYPYVGKVEVAGLKVTEIRDILRERLAEYIESPQVDVTVAAFRSKRAYITGEVMQPGVQPITNIPLTLVEAISQAGGLTELADWTQVTLTRDGETRTFSLKDLLQGGDIRENIVLRPNDIIHVARNDAAKVFVLGEVGEPQSFLIGRSDITLAEALAESGGFNQVTADATGIFVLRKAPADSGKVASVYQMNARNATALVLADQFVLQPRDIVFVTAAPITRWNRIIANLLPTAQSLYYLSLTEERIRDRDE